MRTNKTKSGKISGIAYHPQTLDQTSRIILPPRFSAAAVLLLLLISSSLAFIWAQPNQSDPVRYTPPPSPISAEAAPVLPAVDPRVDEVAAMIPAEAAEALPTKQASKTVSIIKPRPVNLTIRAKPASPPPHQPSQLEVLTARGITYGRQGDYDAAEQSLRAALALDRSNPTILFNLGVVAERRGDADSARTLYEATLRQAAERPDTPLRPELLTARLDALDDKATQ